MEIFNSGFAIGFGISRKIWGIFIRKNLANGITILCKFCVKNASVSFASVLSFRCPTPYKPIAKPGLNRFFVFYFLICSLLFSFPIQSYSAKLRSEDEKFLDMVSQDSFQFFLDKYHKGTGLINDNSTTYSPCSVASVGFGLTAYCIGAQRHWVDKNDAYDRVLKTLKFFQSNVAQKNGFYYHFVNIRTGAPVWNSEVSSIDTAIFLAGALSAGEYFKGTEVELLANELYERVDWPWMLNGKTVLCMGWKPDIKENNGFLPYYWDSYSELMIIYALAIGSPTKPISPKYWDAWKRPAEKLGSNAFIYCPTGSLFVYQYSQAFIDFRNIRDKYANYWTNSVKATIADREWCIENRKIYKGYWGISACLGPDGYAGYGSVPEQKSLHDGTIAPSALAGSIPFCPAECISTMRSLYKNYGTDVYGKYGFVNGVNLNANWFSRDFIGIDQGITVLMIENYRSEFVWKYFMQHPAIKKWLELCMQS